MKLLLSLVLGAAVGYTFTTVIERLTTRDKVWEQFIEHAETPTNIVGVW
jgi:hypothetical protein